MPALASGPTDRLARVHGLLGLSLGAYVGYHLWAQWPALAGREAWLARARADGTGPWEAALVVLVLALHAGLGCVRARRPPPPDTTPDARGLARLQALTGACVLAFAAYHLVQVRAFSTGPHTSALAPYAILRQELGRPLDLVLYLVGLTCLSFHFGHGLARAAAVWGLARRAGSVRTARFLGGLVGFVLWLALLHVLGAFALGEGLFSF